MKKSPVSLNDNIGSDLCGPVGDSDAPDWEVYSSPDDMKVTMHLVCAWLLTNQNLVLEWTCLS